MKNKAEYSRAELEVVYLNSADVIATSGDGWLTNDQNPSYDPDGWS